MIQVKQIDIKIYSGEDFSMTFIVRDPETATARNLTGATVTAQLRSYPSGTDPYDFTVTNYGASGKIRLQIPYETTNQIGYAYGRYEVNVVYPDSTTETVLWGRAFILPAVTRVVTGTAENILAFNSFDEFPEVGTSYRLYLDIEAGLLYRWNGAGYENALLGITGEKGDDGRGIVEINKGPSEGNVDTYEIVYTDNTTSTFQVTNGASIAYIYKTGIHGSVSTYTIELENGNTFTYDVNDGSSIETITLEETDGITDTYLITLTDGTTTNFQVRNGMDGLGAPVHVEGEIAVVTALMPDQLSLLLVDDEIAYVGAMISDTDWQLLDTDTALGSGSYIYYRRVGYQTVIVANEILLASALSSDSITLGTLDSDFRPDLFTVTCPAGSKAQQGIITLDTNGDLKFYKTDSIVTWGTSDKISFQLNYIVAPGTDPTPTP